MTAAGAVDPKDGNGGMAGHGLARMRVQEERDAVATKELMRRDKSRDCVVESEEITCSATDRGTCHGKRKGILGRGNKVADRHGGARLDGATRNWQGGEARGQGASASAS